MGNVKKKWSVSIANAAGTIREFCKCPLPIEALHILTVVNRLFVPRVARIQLVSMENVKKNSR
jgi:hypothetical protein